MANQYAHSQQHLFAQQGVNQHGSRSASPQPFSAPSNALSPRQQQWMSQQSQQQYGSMNNINGGGGNNFNNMMAEHQRQWQEHMAMAAQQHPLQQVPNASSALSLPAHQNLHSPPNVNNAQQQYTAAQYAAWMRQYQQNQHNAQSAMNMQQHYQQQQLAQQQAMRNYQQRLSMAQQQQRQQQHSQRALFQQQAAQNRFASTGNLPIPGNNNNHNHNNVNVNQFKSQNRIYEIKQQQEKDSQHESFVPPAPQSEQEIAKYVEWKAKRRGIDEQKVIEKETKRQQELAAMATEKQKKDTFVSATSSKKSMGTFKEPLLSEDKKHRDSDIDYALENEQSGKSGGCCVVL